MTDSKQVPDPDVRSFTETDWQQRLSSSEFQVLRKSGTERPFTGPYWDEFSGGIYSCTGCGNPLFLSDTKFDAGCGWPSFFQTIAEHSVTEHQDDSHMMTRTEIRCGHCEGHLGHVFPDGPEPTGLRYCMNGTALKLTPHKE
ncbi:MAG: peptide-methionine (R)-S-oxide reductase MsrB [Stappiaceae bacterium]